MKPSIPRTSARHNLHNKVESRTHKYKKVDPKLLKKSTKSVLTECIPTQAKKPVSKISGIFTKLVSFIKETQNLNVQQSEGRIPRQIKNYR